MVKATIDFENLAPPNSPIAVESGYMGLRWDNIDAAEAARYQAATPRSGFAKPLGTSSACNRFAEDAGFGSFGDDTFNLKSAYLAAGWNEGLEVTITGFRDGVQVASRTVVLDTDREFVRFGQEFRGLDYVGIQSEGGRDVVNGGVGDHVSFDNITLTSNDIW